jgi:hypothetical protein
MEKTMGTIQLIQVSPIELADLICENVKVQLKELLQGSAGKPSDDAKEFLTRKQTIELLDISSVTLHAWCKQGILKPYKLGNRTYFKRSELTETLFNSNRV